MSNFPPILMPVAVSALALAAVYSLGFAAPPPSASPPVQSLFYCDQKALTPAERTRHFEVLAPALVAKRKILVHSNDARVPREGHPVRTQSGAKP